MTPLPPGGIYIGADPGASGGLAALYHRPKLSQDRVSPFFSQGTGGDVGRQLLVSTAMPDSPREILDWILDQTVKSADWDVPIFAVIERVGGYNSSGGGESKAGQPGSAMFKFGVSYGLLLMALTASDIPYEEVPPARWQGALHIPKRGKGEARTAWKGRLKAHAAQLYPDRAVTLAVADAILIATYCQRWREGNL